MENWITLKKRVSLLAWLVICCLELVPTSPLAGQEPKLRTTIKGYVTVSPGGQVLAAWETIRDKRREIVGHAVKILDVASGKEMKIAFEGLPIDGRSLKAFSPDSKLLAVGAGKKPSIVQLWDVSTGKMKAGLKGPSGELLCLAFGPDGKLLAAGSGTAVKVWEVATGKEKGSLKNIRAQAVAFSREGDLLATAFPDGTVRLLDIGTGAEKAAFGQPKNAFDIDGVAFSPNGKLLAAWGDTQIPKLWDVTTGKEIGIGTQRHTNFVRSVSFSPDGKTLASAGGKGVRLWDLESGKELATLKHMEPVGFVSFSPDGKTLASAGGNEVRLWDLSPAK